MALMRRDYSDVGDRRGWVDASSSVSGVDGPVLRKAEIRRSRREWRRALDPDEIAVAVTNRSEPVLCAEKDNIQIDRHTIKMVF
jgi:hypothetical protein